MHKFLALLVLCTAVLSLTGCDLLFGDDPAPNSSVTADDLADIPLIVSDGPSQEEVERDEAYKILIQSSEVLQEVLKEVEETAALGVLDQVMANIESQMIILGAQADATDGNDPMPAGEALNLQEATELFLRSGEVFQEALDAAGNDAASAAVRSGMDEIEPIIEPILLEQEGSVTPDDLREIGLKEDEPGELMERMCMTSAGPSGVWVSEGEECPPGTF